MSDPTNTPAHDAGQQAVPLRSLTAAEALRWIEANTVNHSAVTERATALPARDIETVECLFQPRPVAEWHVAEIAAGIQAGRKPDPLLLYAVGGRNLLLDGHHRLAAYRVAGVSEAVPVAHFEGTPREAVLEARARNSATKLPTSSAERHNDAWGLVKLGGFTKEALILKANVSKGSVDAMRKALKTLGHDAAAQITSWQRARAEAFGHGKDMMTPAEHDAWLEEMAEGWAERLHKHFGKKFSGNPEIAAKALARYFGRRTGEMTRHLKDHVSEWEWDEETEEDSEGDY